MSETTMKKIYLTAIQLGTGSVLGSALAEDGTGLATHFNKNMSETTTVAHKTFFKSDMVTRVDARLYRDAQDAADWRRVCRVVDLRDGRACRCCDKRTNPDDRGLLRGHRHHIIFRSACGPDESWNLCTLCARCHSDKHVKRTLRVEGNADLALTFWRKDEAGVWFVARQETAVRVVEHD